MLIGTFVNAIYLYDDKAVIALNYKDGTKTVNFNDMECALSQRASIPGSDLEILSPPNKRPIREDGSFVLVWVFKRGFEPSGSEWTAGGSPEPRGGLSRRTGESTRPHQANAYLCLLTELGCCAFPECLVFTVDLNRVIIIVISLA